MVAAATGAAMGTADPGLAQPVPTPTPTADAPEPGTYGPPIWLPLRADLDGGPVTVGCTYDSHGSANGYECGGHHNRWAIDFLASAGTPVYAAGAGFATDRTGLPGSRGFGLVVQVDHGGGDITLYAHLTSVAVPAEGAWVDQRMLLGTVGSTGSSSANHLHYERRNLLLDEAMDPGVLLACQGDRLVRYPEAEGTDTWKHLPWGAFTVQSDGSDCATPLGVQKPPHTTRPVVQDRPPRERVRDRVRRSPWSLLFRGAPATDPTGPVDPVDAALERLLSPPS